VAHLVLLPAVTVVLDQSGLYCRFPQSLVQLLLAVPVELLAQMAAQVVTVVFRLVAAAVVVLAQLLVATAAQAQPVL
jgi:hypothetical protein